MRMGVIILCETQFLTWLDTEHSLDKLMKWKIIMIMIVIIIFIIIIMAQMYACFTSRWE